MMKYHETYVGDHLPSFFSSRNRPFSEQVERTRKQGWLGCTQVCPACDERLQTINSSQHDNRPLWNCIMLDGGRQSSRNVLVHCLTRYLFTYVGDGNQLNENQLAKVVNRQVNPTATLSAHPEQR